MAATVVTPVDAVSPYTGLAALVWTDADVADGLVIPLTRREILLFRDDTGAGVTITITSTAMAGSARTGNVTQAIAAGSAFDDVYAWGLSELDGFANASVQVAIPQTAALQVAVLRVQR